MITSNIKYTESLSPVASLEHFIISRHETDRKLNKYVNPTSFKSCQNSCLSIEKLEHWPKHATHSLNMKMEKTICHF